MLYQIMKVYADGSVGRLGRTIKSLRRAKIRLRKQKKGWIIALTAEGKVVICTRGFRDFSSLNLEDL